MIDIKIRKLIPDAQLPMQMTAHSAGYDLFSSNNEDIILKSGNVQLVPTGIAISIPKGYEVQIRPRSGLAIKHQIGVLNSPGTIDADYRGEIKIILFNFGKDDFLIKPKTRVAQMVVSKHEVVNFVITDELDETDRGKGGFGHTSL